MERDALVTLSAASHLSVVFALAFLSVAAAAAVLALVRCGRLSRRGARLLLGGMLGVYFAAYLYLAFFYRPPLDRVRTRMTLFWSYREAFSLEGGLHIRRLGIARSILLNVLFYIPLGAVLPALFRTLPPASPLARRPFLSAFLLALLLSAATEALQLVTRRGLCELDDLLDNGLGAALGLLALRLADGLLRRFFPRSAPDSR